MSTSRTLLAPVLATLVLAGAPVARAYNSDPVCYDEARRPLAADAAQCAIRDPLGTHALIAWFAARYLAATYRDAASAEGKAAAWATRFVGTSARPGALLRGANAPDTLDTRVDVYRGRGGDGRGEVVFTFPRGDKLLEGTIPVAGAISSALADVVNKIGRFFGVKEPVIPTFAQLVRSAISKLPDGQPKAFLAQVFTPKDATTSVLRQGLNPPLHLSALGHFVRRERGGIAGYKVTGDSSLWITFADALVGSARAVLGEKVFVELRNRIVAPIRARAKSTVEKILAIVRVGQWSADGRAAQPARASTDRLGKAQFTSADAMADWWYRTARSYQSARDDEGAVLSLAHAAHYLQDNALPHHNYGFLFKGHGPYEDRAGSYVAEFYAKAAADWRQRPAGFDALVAKNLSHLRTFHGAPGALLTGHLWTLVQRAQPNLATRAKDLDDPGMAGALADLARAVASTSWLLLKFHREAVR